MTLSSSPSSTLSFVETYDWDLSETEKSRALWIKLHTIWFLIIYQPRYYRPLVRSIGGKLRGPPPRFLRLWWASPVYHSRRGFRSTPFAALIKGNREITTTSPPPPPCKPLDGSMLSEHNLTCTPFEYGLLLRIFLVYGICWSSIVILAFLFLL